MTWFLIAVLVALGGVFAAYKRGKRMPMAAPKPAATEGTCINAEDPAEKALRDK